jgi:hypothetical protein
MKTKLLYIASMYTMALVAMIVCIFINDIEINGQAAGVIGRAVCGFLFGMALEAMFLWLLVLGQF